MTQVSKATSPAGTPTLPKEPDWLVLWRKCEYTTLTDVAKYIDSLHEHYRRELRSQFLDAVDKCASLQTTLAEREKELEGNILIPRTQLVKWREGLDRHWFNSDGEDEYNNEEVIEVCHEIDDLLAYG